MIRVFRAEKVRGELRTPGNKSVSHRALMISAMSSHGISTIRGLSTGTDVRDTEKILGLLGARISWNKDQCLVESAELRPARTDLYCGNSGTTMRLLAGLLGGIGGSHRLVGDESLSRRPMDRIATPLGEMGIQLDGQGDSVTAPLTLSVPQKGLRAIDYEVPIPSAQVKSAVLFAGLAATGTTSVYERLRTRSNTESMLRTAGIDVRSENHGQGRLITLTPGNIEPVNWEVPGDPSQAAFWIVLGLIHPDADICVKEVEGGEERNGYIQVLRRMGGDITRSGEEVCELRAASSALVATDIYSSEIPSVDEVPILVVAASASQGSTRFIDMGELRLKESNRFEESVRLARALGATVTVAGDDFIVDGLGSAEAFESFTFDGLLDHRLVMAAAVAGAAGSGSMITSEGAVESSYPDFFSELEVVSCRN